MFVLKVKIEGKPHLFHDGNFFVGGKTRKEAEIAAQNNSAVMVSVGGFDIVEVSPQELAEMLGTTVENPSYKILAAHGGLIPFYVVPLVKDGGKP